MSASTSLAAPVQQTERIQIVDILRGFALFGILFVNMMIFYGYGLGLFGKVGLAAGIGLTIVIYLLQIPISHWWMKRFKYGPAEWLWRSLTYLKPQPIRRNGVSE